MVSAYHVCAIKHRDNYRLGNSCSQDGLYLGLVPAIFQFIYPSTFPFDVNRTAR